jgi:dsDNA-binding SOS-regulon protein
MKIKRVAQYQTSDGQTFAEKKNAQAHQKALDRRDNLAEIIKAKGEYIASDAAGYAEYIADLILENADAIRAVLPQRAAKTETNEAQPVEVASEPTIENDMSWIGAGLAGSVNLSGVSA